MALFTGVLFLAAVWLPLFPANGQDPKFGALSTTLQKVQSEIVNKHNDLRRRVSPPASNMLKMQWDSKAAANAQNWANKCLLKHSKPEDRTVGTRRCGENLFMSSHPLPWSDATQSWYDEVRDFTFAVGPNSPQAVVGHYTQLVWYSSYRIGCAVAYCPNQPNLKYFYVCQYCPAGNIVGREHVPYQKGTPCGSCPKHCDKGLCTNSCEYDDAYANCKSLKETWTCNNNIVKNNCQASCKCPDKIY
ncbi:cysteine-rich secretory protein 3-like [Hippopotamus amphibius kiboko]|uniref:cysteine-rich secretory protein 3-like n=1 Tax=Hippopotamus amphibius kiboko TaxID=575201 RepID=UPI002594A3F2|nr:cysteine-rich secretory protein 3-like [Hippopotamus amphibius kiboko]